MRKEVKIGLVALLTLMSFFFLFNFLKGKNLFVSGRVFYVKYDDVNGLAPSKPVTMNGLRVGRIDEINIIDDVTPIYFVVKMSISKNAQFSKKSIAEIHEPGLMSGKELRILLDYNGPLAKTGDTIAGRVAGGIFGTMTEQFSPTKNKLDSVLITLSKTMESINLLLDDENKSSIKNLLNNLNETAASFNTTAKSITATSNSANKLISKNEATIDETLRNANKMLATVNTTVSKFGQTADKFNELELKEIVTHFENVSKNLDLLINKINGGEGTLGALMNDKTIYNNLDEASKNLNQLLEDLKENPNKYVQFSIFGKKSVKIK